jgi:hypothetical protein
MPAKVQRAKQFQLNDDPNAFDEGAGRLLVDDEAKELFRCGGIASWLHGVATEAATIQFFKRAVQAGLWAAHNAHNAILTDEALEDWGRTAVLAAKASAAVDTLLANLSGGHLKALGARSLDNMMLLAGGSTALPQAQQQADDLLRAKSLLSTIAENLRENGARRKRGRQNAGDPAKAAFVLTMVEAWVYMTCKVPAASDAHLLDFISAGWQDAGGPFSLDPEGKQLTDFTRAIQSAVRALKRNALAGTPHYRPAWVF